METSSNFHGVYMGAQKPHQKSFVDDSDLVVVFGPHFSTTNQLQPNCYPESRCLHIVHGNSRCRLATRYSETCPPRYFLPSLLDALEREPTLQRYEQYPDLETPTSLVQSLSPASPDDLVTQKEFYLRLSSFFRPGDIILAETGTAGWGAREMHSPTRCVSLGRSTWLSIGYMLPAAQGAALAQRDMAASTTALSNGDKPPRSGRTILIIGDGSFQMTVQELSTIIRENLNVICLVINNDGYTVERCITARTRTTTTYLCGVISRPLNSLEHRRAARGSRTLSR